MSLDTGISRGLVQAGMLVTLIIAIVASVVVAAIQIPKSSQAYIENHPQVLTTDPANTQKSKASLIADHRRASYEKIVTIIIGLFLPILTIMVTTILMDDPNQRKLPIDFFRASVVFWLFMGLQIVAFLILEMEVANTEDLTSLRADAASNAVLLSLQSVVVAFAFPKREEPKPP